MKIRHRVRCITAALMGGSLWLLMSISPGAEQQPLALDVGIMVPTNPCEWPPDKPCPTPEVTSMDLSRTIAEYRRTTDRKLTQSLNKASDKSQKDQNVERRLACRDAFLKYATDGTGRRLAPDLEAQWREACFSSVENLGSTLADQVRATVVIVTINDQPMCVGSLLNSTRVLTARHCFLMYDKWLEDPSRPLEKDRVSSAKIHGLISEKKFWHQEVLSVRLDPFDSKTPDYAETNPHLEARRKSAPKTLDFLVLEIKPLENGASPVALVQKGELQNLPKYQRLLVATFYGGQLYVDDMVSCAVREYEPLFGYLHHHCQSLGGVSGAPIFIFDPTQGLRLMAVHASPAGEMHPSKTHASKDPKVGGNEGSVLPETVFNKLYGV